MGASGVLDPQLTAAGLPAGTHFNVSAVVNVPGFIRAWLDGSTAVVSIAGACFVNSKYDVARMTCRGFNVVSFKPLF